MDEVQVDPMSEMFGNDDFSISSWCSSSNHVNDDKCSSSKDLVFEDSEDFADLDSFVVDKIEAEEPGSTTDDSLNGISCIGKSDDEYAKVEDSIFGCCQHSDSVASMSKLDARWEHHYSALEVGIINERYVWHSPSIYA